jgi:hypothetical protein
MRENVDQWSGGDLRVGSSEANQGVWSRVCPDRRDEIDRVVVVAPLAEVVNQWAEDFRRVSGRFMTKVTGCDQDIETLDLDLLVRGSRTTRRLSGLGISRS